MSIILDDNRLSTLISGSLPSIAHALASGEVSSIRLTQFYLERIARLNPQLQAYVTISADAALAQAAIADKARNNGHLIGVLHGVPIALKDLCETDFAPTSNGMAIYRTRNTGRNAAVVEHLLATGAVILGKLAMAEGANSSHHPDMPIPINPWGASFRVGSSSSGSGVAVAAGLAAAAVGSDTGGSIRFPSVYCGITGFKPTRGLLSTAGICAMAPSLDHLGPMASNAAGCALLLKGMSVDRTLPSIEGKRYRFGYVPKLLEGRLDPEVAVVYKQLIQSAELNGFQLIACDTPDTPQLHETWLRICAREIVAGHSTTYPARRAEYGKALAALLDLGINVSDADYAAALVQQMRITNQWNELFETLDWLALPVHATIPPLLDNALGALNASIRNPLEYTAVANITGLPALALSTSCDARGCPIGVQIMGPRYADLALLELGRQLQEGGFPPLALPISVNSTEPVLHNASGSVCD